MININCNIEQAALKRLIFYENKNVKLKRPDISKLNEIHLVNYSGASLIVDYNENPTWERTHLTGENYRQLLIDGFSFYISKYEENKVMLKYIRENRNGFIAEIQLLSGENYIFPNPVFYQESTTKGINYSTQKIKFEYRIPSTVDYLKKLNNVVFSANYLYVEENSLLGANQGIAIIYQ